MTPQELEELHPLMFKMEELEDEIRGIVDFKGQDPEVGKYIDGLLQEHLKTVAGLRQTLVSKYGGKAGPPETIR